MGTFSAGPRAMASGKVGARASREMFEKLSSQAVEILAATPSLTLTFPGADVLGGVEAVSSVHRPHRDHTTPIFLTLNIFVSVISNVRWGRAPCKLRGNSRGACIFPCFQQGQTVHLKRAEFYGPKLIPPLVVSLDN